MAKNTEELRNVCVSDGTMRTEDLFPKMYWLLKEYAPEKAKEFAEFAEDDSWMGGSEEGAIMDALFDALNEIAPEGCIFGSQEGDGACYGFWEMEEESCKRRGRMLREGLKPIRKRIMRADDEWDSELDEAANSFDKGNVQTAVDDDIYRAHESGFEFDRNNAVNIRNLGFGKAEAMTRGVLTCEEKDKSDEVVACFVVQTVDESYQVISVILTGKKKQAYGRDLAEAADKYFS